MQHRYDYLIIGAGMSAEAAAHGIREEDAHGSIGLLGAEEHPPYNRPPLTKGLWKGDPVEQIWRPLESSGAILHRGCRALALDPATRIVTDARGDTHVYRKLLLATGGTPRQLGFSGERVVNFRTFDDYRRLRELAQPGRHIAVAGGGFIGSELAAALTMSGCKVSLLFPDAGIGARVFPAALAAFLDRHYRGKGVDVRTGVKVSGGSAAGDGVQLQLSDGTVLSADAVVAGLGITPSSDLAQAAGLQVDNGIVVDAFLRSSAPDIYAAGDVASYPDATLGKRRRVEHEDAALTMGRHAGRNMAGANLPYTHLPFFYSDLFDLGYEAVGEIDARLETVEEWSEPFREGVVYYLDAGRVRGVLLWNTWGQVDNASALIAEPAPHSRESLRGRLPR